MSLNLDALAEATYADSDPTYSQIDDDLEAQKEREREKTLSYVEHRIRDIFEDLNEDELRICAEHADSIADFLIETVEEMV